MNLEGFTTKELLAKYNELAEKSGRKIVKRFSDRRAGMRRLQKLLDEVGGEPEVKFNPPPETVESPPVKEKKAKSRPSGQSTEKASRAVFNFPPKQVIKEVRPGTLREGAIKLLTKGATLKQVEELCRDWHVEQGITPHHVERRAYELVRLLNHYVGWGLKQEGEKIFVYSNQMELDLTGEKQ